MDVFLGISQKFQTSYVKEQWYFHAVGTLEETDVLLKNLLSALVIHNICKFKTF